MIKMMMNGSDEDGNDGVGGGGGGGNGSRGDDWSLTQSVDASDT